GGFFLSSAWFPLSSSFECSVFECEKEWELGGVYRCMEAAGKYAYGNGMGKGFGKGDGADFRRGLRKHSIGFCFFSFLLAPRLLYVNVYPWLPSYSHRTSTPFFFPGLP